MNVNPLAGSLLHMARMHNMAKHAIAVNHNHVNASFLLNNAGGDSSTARTVNKAEDGSLVVASKKNIQDGEISSFEKAIRIGSDGSKTFINKVVNENGDSLTNSIKKNDDGSLTAVRTKTLSTGEVMNVSGRTFRLDAGSPAVDAGAASAESTDTGGLGTDIIV